MNLFEWEEDRRLWQSQWSVERNLVKQRQQALTRAWKLSKSLKSHWRKRFRRKSKPKKLLKSLSQCLLQTETLSRPNHRRISKKIQQFKCLISPSRDDEQSFFRELDLLLSNERELYGMAANKSRHMKVFTTATTRLLESCEW